jgi:hypothetical protein
MAFAAALIGLSSYSHAAQNGINYDPAHNPAYVEAQRNNNLPLMKSLINTDLAKIKNTLRFNIIKTFFFFSRYCTNIPTCVPIAELARDAGLQVLLGVYEFTPENTNHGCTGNGVTGNCATVWTKSGVEAAITSANTYPNTVIGIVVGNEDMFDHRGNAILDLQQRIVVDIDYIKPRVNESLPVTTAQRQPDWCGGPMRGCASNRSNSLNQKDDYHVLQTVRGGIGVNIYPYWGGSDEKINGVSVASQIQTTAMDLKAALNKDVSLSR